MVVHYIHKVSTIGREGSFARLIFRWRGSVYKMVWKDMLMYLLLYFSISFVYRFGLDEPNKRTFEKLSLHCSHFRNLIPISFVLGFYVSLVVSRWWGMYESLPWPDKLSVLLSTHIQGQDAKARMMRCTVIRYVNLSFVITFSMIAPSVKKNFPTLQQMVDAGYMTSSEKDILEDLENKTKVHKTWVPYMWACQIIDKARREGRIRDDVAQKTLTDEVLALRGYCGSLLGWDEYNIPLVYTQVVTIAVYSFFLFSVIGEQFLDPAQGYPNNLIDIYIPIFTLLQFFFYIGWLKVAESLINPFGDDDHDFEFVPLLKRHLEMSYLLADPQPNEIPTMVTDDYWETTFTPVEGRIRITNADFLLANQFTPAAEV